MSERFTDAELERALREVGAQLAYPRAVDLLPAVRARIEDRRGGWAWLRSPRLALVPAVATVVLLLAATLAFQPIGARAAEALGLRGLVVFFGGEQVPATNGKAILPDARKVASVADASREVGFTVLAPVSLGAPDEVYVRTTPQGSQAFLVYGTRTGITASKETGIGVLVTEALGSFESPLLGKVLPQGSRAEQVTVNGEPGVWIAGAPHQFFFRAPNGEVVIDSLRLSGNVLVWDQGPVLIRLEADVTKDKALGIASSMR